MDRIENSKKHSLSEKNAKSPSIASSNSDSEVVIQLVSHKSGSRTSQTLKNIRKYCKKNRDPNVCRTLVIPSVVKTMLTQRLQSNKLEIGRFRTILLFLPI